MSYSDWSCVSGILAFSGVHQWHKLCRTCELGVHTVSLLRQCDCIVPDLESDKMAVQSLDIRHDFRPMVDPAEVACLVPFQIVAIENIHFIEWMK